MNALVVCALFFAAGSPLERGQTHWHAMDLEKAAAQFEKAVTTAQDDDARAQALVWLGLARAELGDFARAKTAFMSALRLRSDVDLPASAGEIAPRVRGLFEAARLDVEGPRPLPREPLPDEPLPPIHGEPGSHGSSSPSTPLTPPTVATVGAAPVDDGPPVLVVGAIALAGSGVMLLGTAAVVDVAAGPELLDGGALSVACMGAGAVMLLAGGALGAVALLSR